MTSYVDNEIGAELGFDIKEVLDTVTEKILSLEGCPYEVQVNLLVTDDQGIWELNREYRQVDAPTDVLSFPALVFQREADFSVAEENRADYFDPDSGELVLGDIIISADKVKEQAGKYGHSVKREFAFLIAHSVLHLCGYDHMEENAAQVMEHKQEKALSLLGITRDN